MPRREQRLNPEPRRPRKAEPLGPEWMVLGAEATCSDCGWISVATTDEEAAEMQAKHTKERHA
jgi:hypothetical protein